MKNKTPLKKTKLNFKRLRKKKFLFSLEKMRNEIYISATSNGIDSILLSNDVSSEDSKKKRDSEYEKKQRE